ncbi:MAG: capsular polysaccharide biosynthesis protein [Oceanospirillaceae bacterium]|nr:capsular polysaccharide biosynthesis protein [Oceanospirillaceae bacterium]
MIGYFSAGIDRIKHLSAFLDAPCKKVSGYYPGGSLHAIAGWGLKPTSWRARKYAAARSLPYISLEDGFLRSLDLGVSGAATHSLIVDHSGIYYDATRKSDLESLILAGKQTKQELLRATDCMHRLTYSRLSKYNHAPDEPFCLDSGKRGAVLVVDQTVGDASVEYGLADASSFEGMLVDALADNPDSEVLVKVHPDVIRGSKQGYLLEAARRYGCRVVGEDLSPWSLLDAVQKVYVVTSQMGFEGLIAGKEVHCYGMPFYAGWGLTRDRLLCPRRGEKRSLEQLFAAAYIQYCRYINPLTGQRCELEETIALIADQKRHLERFSGKWLACGFSGWKKRFLGQYFGSKSKLRFAPLDKRALGRIKVDEQAVCWSSKITEAFISACELKGAALWRMEDGFVRSVGLGADLVRPLSLVIDSRGIYYDATVPSDLEHILNQTEFSDFLLQRARQVRERLVSLRLSKYNVGRSISLELPRERKILLVPGQVETDASIDKGSPQIKTNAELLAAVRRENPEAFIIYKPHPDVLGGGRYGELPNNTSASLYDLQVTDMAITDLLDRVDEVHTMSSLTGFEALLRGVDVFTYGMPFYAGWGLTRDRLACERRRRKLTLDELVTGALILYPVYVDPASGQVCNIETAIDLIARGREKVGRPPLKTRFYRMFRNRFLKR